MVFKTSLLFVCIFSISLTVNGVPPQKNVEARGTLVNARIQFDHQKKGHVAFMGGSITEMNGYRPMVCENLKKRFPETKFTFTNAGISSTCSTTGAFRLTRDVLAKGPVDLFFVEFAVNDDQDAAHTRKECIRGMEGIISQIRKHNPFADIVMVHFVNPGMLMTIQEGKEPLPMEAHNEVAKRYNVSVIHLAREVADQIKADKLTWKQFGGTHPAPYGNRICANMIEEMFTALWSKPLSPDGKKVEHKSPEKLLDEKSYKTGRLMAVKKSRRDQQWKILVPEWKKLPGSSRSRFTSIPMLTADQPGAELTLRFVGTAIGAYLVAGPDAGMVEVSIDDGPFKQFDLYHRYSRGLHYPRTVMFADELSTGAHLMRLRIARTKNNASRGNAMRAMSFVVNVVK